MKKYKNICICTLVMISLSSYAYEVYQADNYNEKLGKHVGECGKPYIKVLFKVDKNTQGVMVQYSSLETGESSDPFFLSNCKVIDDKNWICESKPSLFPTHIFYDSTHKVMDGKYFFTDAYKELRGSDKKIPVGPNYFTSNQHGKKPVTLIRHYLDSRSSKSINIAIPNL